MESLSFTSILLALAGSAVLTIIVFFVLLWRDRDRLP